MVERLAIPAEDIINWVFQIEHQSFITRYGVSGGEFYKQTVLQSGARPSTNSVKRIHKRVYELAFRRLSVKS